MTLTDLARDLDLSTLTPSALPATEVTGAYVGDLLSDVLAHGAAGQVWITLQVHAHIVAVAGMKDLAAILVINGRRPEPETLARAAAEGIPILGSAQTAFDLAGQLYERGLRGEGP